MEDFVTLDGMKIDIRQAQFLFSNFLVCATIYLDVNWTKIALVATFVMKFSLQEEMDMKLIDLANGIVSVDLNW